jgi:uncharacterized protein YcfJ
MLKTLTLAAAATSLLAATTLPADASARTRHHYTHKTCRSAANTGTAIGAIAGGLIGNKTGNHGTGSTLLGAGLGGVAGHQIAKSHCKARHR